MKHSKPQLNLPEGFVYKPDLIDLDEERFLVKTLQQLDFSAVVMHGANARRKVIHYGWVYGFDSYRLAQGPPIPEFLLPIRIRAAELMRVSPDELAEALLTEYPPGATIGWHRDAPLFGRVAGVSLLSSCYLRFRRGDDGERLRAKIELEPRSAYLLRGAARNQWQHSIPAVPLLRYSLTFRTLRINA